MSVLADGGGPLWGHLVHVVAFGVPLTGILVVVALEKVRATRAKARGKPWPPRGSDR